MKKIISLILAVSLMLTMVFTAAVSVSAATTITDVDASKLDRIGVDSDKNISLSIPSKNGKTVLRKKKVQKNSFQH